MAVTITWALGAGWLLEVPGLHEHESACCSHPSTGAENSSRAATFAYCVSWVTIMPMFSESLTFSTSMVQTSHWNFGEVIHLDIRMKKQRSAFKQKEEVSDIEDVKWTQNKNAVVINGKNNNFHITSFSGSAIRPVSNDYDSAFLILIPWLHDVQFRQHEM